jgi:non-ribosomal peptide synthetase component F/ubiquinone/menaquinone biosynthesis C-methylase UbiE
LRENLPDESKSELELEQVSEWQTVWDQTYSQTAQLSDPSFNLSGWNSSYTGLPVPAGEMREWIEHTVDRILSLKPRRVLEIGCGTGLLLFKIAPHCDKYTGMEFSQPALQYLDEQLRSAMPGLPQVELRACTATDIEDIAAESVDTIILNSVIQYFPDVNYLLRVIELAVRKVCPGGAIFIGDVRSLPLLETFHASVQLHQSPAALSRAALAQRVRKCVAEEKELVINPDLFTALQNRLPQISKVEIHVKRGRYHNELTRFRYDVVLRVGRDEPTIPESQTIDWQRQGFDLELLQRFLEEDQPDMLVVTRVPNARLSADVEARAMIESSEGPETAGVIRAKLREIVNNSGVDPEDLWELGDQLSYLVEIGCAGSDPTGSLTVTFTRRTRSHSGPTTGAGILQKPVTQKPLKQLANNPLQRKLYNTLVTELRQQLRRSLPEYMVPEAFVMLDDLPLTPNGKIDRKRLPAPAPDRLPVGQSYVSPRTEVEATLATIWEDVLRVEQVGVHDNFFELGGHSLRATQLISRVRHTFGVEIPLRELFERPTVASLSEGIERARQLMNNELGAAPLLPVSRDERLPLSFAQERLWFLDQLEPGSASYNMPAAVRLTGKLDLAATQAAINEVVRRHEALRTSFITVDGEPEQMIALELTLPFTVLDLASVPTAEREAKTTQLAQEEAQRPFDLSKGPLLRSTLLRLSDEEHILLLTMHHIISDGWSMGILVKEVATLYEALAAGQPSPLAEPTIQYADYAVWQRKWLQGAVLENQIEYWKQQLAGVESLQLPTDRPRPPAQTFNGANYNFELQPELRESIHALSRREGTTLFMTLLAAFQTLLHRYTGQEDISIGTPIAGRIRLETESLIGFFVNTLVLRAQLNGDENFSEVLRKVREITLQAHAHQDVPFEKLVEELQPQRDMSRTPLFQVMFTLQNMAEQQIKLSDLSMKPFGANGTTSRY